MAGNTPQKADAVADPDDEEEKDDDDSGEDDKCLVLSHFFLVLLTGLSLHSPMPKSPRNSNICHELSMFCSRHRNDDQQ